MKRVTILVGILMFVVFVSSCSTGSANYTNNSSNSNQNIDVEKEEKQAETLSKHVLSDEDKEKIRNYFDSQYIVDDKNFYYFDININTDGTYDISAQLCHPSFKDESFCQQLTKEFCKKIVDNGEQECFDFVSIMYVTEYAKTSYWFGVREFYKQENIENAVAKLP